MRPGLDAYADAAGPEVIDELRKLARPLEGKKVVHVNSTRLGGGVAEILMWQVRLMEELGIRSRWETILGDADFFAVTKSFHNALQGQSLGIPKRLLDHYLDVNRENARTLQDALDEADFVFIHDPQPAALLGAFPARRGKWIWRCHIDVSRPNRTVWKFIRDQVKEYDASVFSLAAFAQPLPHPQYLIPPSIDPLSDKNRPLEPQEIDSLVEGLGVQAGRSVLLQVSRFDRFKDPVGVIRAYRMLRPYVDVQLVLAGGTATDDPESDAVLEEVRWEAEEDPDIHVLLLAPDAHKEINALQRRADVVLQKSLREGFGLTVTEALWKGKPVIGGETGGIRLQVVNGHTGFRVSSPEGAAFRARYLLARPEVSAVMGEKARRLVRENFLLTRHLREYLTLMLALEHGAGDRVEIT